jgi:hypothetical protein
MVKGEILTLGAAAGALGGAYKLAEFITKAKRMRDVGPSNAVYVRIIGRVRADLDEVRRLLSVREVHDALESNPDKSKWVYGCMRDVRGALENITPHTERVAGDIEDGRRVGIRHKVHWLLSEREKLENREKELSIAHASLTEVLGYLTGLEPVEEPEKPQSKKDAKEAKESRETHIDIDIHHDAPPPPPPQQYPQQPPQHNTMHIDRDVWVERDRQPPVHYEEHRDIYVDEHGRPVPPQYNDQRGGGGGDPRYDAQYEHQGRDPRYDGQYEQQGRYEAQYEGQFEQDQYRTQYPEQMQDPYNQGRPFPPPPGRRPEYFEDRMPERDSWQQSNARNDPRQGQYAEYGAPQPIGAAHYQRRFKGDAGFGDEEILNPQPVPLDRKTAEREVSGHGYRYGSKL